jgi:broad specificity phosphatase PhoE
MKNSSNPAHQPKKYKDYEFIFVRHGQTIFNVKKAFVGISDDPLNEKGRQQAHKTGQYLASNKFEFDIGFTSPLSRARETAEIIQQYIPFQLQLEPLLRERNYGIFEGRTVDDLKQNESEFFAQYQSDKANTTILNGESIRPVEDRIKELFWNRIPKDFPNSKRIICITHQNPIRAFKVLLGEATEQIYYHKLKNASIAHIQTNFQNTAFKLWDFQP